MLIPEYLLQKFHMNTLAEYKTDFGDSTEVEIFYYHTFLIQSDYISNKIADAAALQEPFKPEYLEILQLRQEARDRINELEAQG